MRTDRHEHAGDVPNGRHGLLRHAQLGRRAAPEQISRRRGDHGHLGAEGAKLGTHLIQAQLQEVGVDQQDLVTAGFEQCLRIAVLQRQVRIATAEIDAALKGPVRVDQRHPHAGTFSISGGISCSICPAQPPGPSAGGGADPQATLVFARQPVSRSNFRCRTRSSVGRPAATAQTAPAGGQCRIR